MSSDPGATLPWINAIVPKSPDTRHHTDADGDESSIDAEQMDAEGEGESQPVDRNDNPAGNANNRVEFIKK